MLPLASGGVDPRSAAAKSIDQIAKLFQWRAVDMANRLCQRHFAGLQQRLTNEQRPDDLEHHHGPENDCLDRPAKFRIPIHGDCR